MSRALDIFTKLETGKIEYCDFLIKNKVSEELFLDYKCVSTSNLSGRLQDDDKKNFSKCISGFGNSDGGVVIWGISCKPSPLVGDVPSGYQGDVGMPCSYFSAVWFKSMLESFTSGATIPPHQGVRHIHFDRTPMESGVVVTYIPAGFSVPFRSVSDGKDAYYIRAGSDFRQAPHGVLAALFGQRPQPIPELSCKLFPKHFGAPAPQSNHPLWVVLELQIKNVGRGMADDIFILLDVKTTPFKCNSHSMSKPEWQIENYIEGQWEGPRTAVTRPSTLRLPPGGTMRLRFDLVALESPDEFRINVTAGLSGGPSASHELFISAQLIKEALSAYLETPLVNRHEQYTMELISGKLKV